MAALFASVTCERALAHHAFQAEHDCNAPVLLHGKVIAVEWQNPHTWIHLTVTEPGKDPVDWMAEGATPNSMLRQNLDRSTLKVGADVVIRGYQARDKRCLESPLTHTMTCKASGQAISIEGAAWVYMGVAGEGAPYDPVEPPGCCEEVTWGKRVVTPPDGLGSPPVRNGVTQNGTPVAGPPSDFRGCRVDFPQPRFAK